ncbi:MAG: PIN domain-containing protein [Candidatus Kuenenia sp.]|nr:PIN domain-containing protein [Candidatus Kuenenia hertensis]
MKDNIFIDTNILIYYVSIDITRKSIAKDLIIDNDEIIISSQVITEFIAVTTKKQILPYDESVKYAKEFMDIFNFSLVNKGTIESSFELRNKYGYSIWDSLIIASALENDCSTLYTEDMKNGQIIENRLKIINPFEKEE